MGTPTKRTAERARHPRSILSLAGLVLATFLGLTASTAGAQGEEAVITVDQAHPASGATHYYVTVIAAGGEPVDGASVTATPIAPDGTQGEAVTLDADGGGVYQGLVPMPSPGSWTIRFTSTNPSATIDHTEVVEGEAPAPTAPPTTSPPAPAPTQSTTTVAETTTSVDDTDDDEGDEEATTTTEGDDSDDSSPLPLILGGVALIVVLGGFLYMATRRSSDEPDELAPPDTDDDTPLDDTRPM
jgi:hypothetical protein